MPMLKKKSACIQLLCNEKMKSTIWSKPVKTDPGLKLNKISKKTHDHMNRLLNSFEGLLIGSLHNSCIKYNGANDHTFHLFLPTLLPHQPNKTPTVSLSSGRTRRPEPSQNKTSQVEGTLQGIRKWSIDLHHFCKDGINFSKQLLMTELNLRRNNFHIRHQFFQLGNALEP